MWCDSRTLAQLIDPPFDRDVVSCIAMRFVKHQKSDLVYESCQSCGPWACDFEWAIFLLASKSASLANNYTQRIYEKQGCSYFLRLKESKLFPNSFSNFMLHKDSALQVPYLWAAHLTNMFLQWEGVAFSNYPHLCVMSILSVLGFMRTGPPLVAQNFKSFHCRKCSGDIKGYSNYHKEGKNVW